MPVRHLNQIELSRRWQVSPRTLERWRWLGQGPRFMKLGGRVAYRLEDVEAFEVEQLRQRTPRRRRSGASTIGPKDARMSSLSLECVRVRCSSTKYSRLLLFSTYFAQSIISVSNTLSF
jgi:hypothetical protein